MSKQRIKSIIDANIYQNDAQEITGEALNGVLNEMVEEFSLISIDAETGVLTYMGKRFQLIAIEEEEPIYTGAICGRAVCGTAICGTN